jgi:primase-polymerase (primpol)-like protein
MQNYLNDHWQNIPDEIKAWPQFVLWREDQKPMKSKPDKVPLDPRTAQFGTAHSPANWLSFDRACSAALQWGVGIGFVLTPHDPFACIDLDGCVTPDGAVSPVALEIVHSFRGWVEHSHSGRGLHVWIKGTVPGGGRRGGKGNAIEAYSAKRFIAMTGRVFAL